MTTIETRDEYQLQQISELQADKSQLQGEVHQLLLDIRELHNRGKENNLVIIELQARCCNCGVGER